jgi:hypothetical protein
MRNVNQPVMVVFVGVIFAYLVLAAAVLALRQNETGHYDVTQALETGLARLPKKQGSQADTSHVGNGVLPPTNSWISGAVLQREPQPVFPLPLSVKLSDTGYELGLPKVSVHDGVITAPHIPAVTVKVEDAVQMRLVRFDKISATLSYRDSKGDELGTLTIAEGSPYGFYRAKRAQTLKLDRADQADGGRFGIVANSGADLRDDSVKLPAGGLLSIFAIGKANEAALRAAAQNAITSVDTTFKRTGNAVETILTYHTTGGETRIGRPDYTKTGGGDYQTLYGPLDLQRTNQLRFSVPYVVPQAELDLSKLSANEETALRAQLTSDVAATELDAPDPYFGGKQLARAANLLSVAEQLGDKRSAETLQARLVGVFGKRLGSQGFYYDTELKGVAPLRPAFGSEDFNDHHFHYGYWLYAASILARYDESFVSKYRTQLDLLAADIASPRNSNSLPGVRVYDPYAGHSWAAGLAPFADGNNQESSSEAVNAWNAVALWGRATHNNALEETGETLLANEAAAARQLWREPILSGYNKPLVSLNWGGKREYATFFSNEPSAKLGIQLIPMSPVQLTYHQDGKAISKLVSETIKSDNYDVPLGDYVLMYSALADSQRAPKIMKQPELTVDDGNSRTYLYAWVYSLLH